LHEIASYKRLSTHFHPFFIHYSLISSTFFFCRRL